MSPQHTISPSAGQHSPKGPVQTEDLVLMGGHCVEWDSWAAWVGEGRGGEGRGGEGEARGGEGRGGRGEGRGGRGEGRGGEGHW